MNSITDDYYLGAPPGFRVMVKPAGPRCNLNCGYCYYLRKADLYPGSKFHMEEQVLREFIRQFIAAHRIREITFDWQGGEPTLLGIGFFEKVVAFQREFCPPDKKIVNHLQTNATLLDEKWCDFLSRNKFLLGISIDGPSGSHDQYRIDKGGNETHDRIVDNVHMLKKYGIEFNVLCCVSTQNVERPEIVYRFFRNVLGARFIQLIPIVNKFDPKAKKPPFELTPYSISGKAWGEFLVKFFEEWIKKDVGTVFVQIFDTMLSAWVKDPIPLCVFSKTCGNCLILEHNGDLYMCDHFVEPEYLLGNITETNLAELAGSMRQKTFGIEKHSSLPTVCRECTWLFCCNGECPKNRLSVADNSEEGLNTLCEGYKRFFSHIDEPMRFMAKCIAEKSPPSEVMKWYASRKRGGK